MCSRMGAQHNVGSDGWGGGLGLGGGAGGSAPPPLPLERGPRGRAPRRPWYFPGVCTAYGVQAEMVGGSGKSTAFNEAPKAVCSPHKTAPVSQLSALVGAAACGRGIWCHTVCRQGHRGGGIAGKGEWDGGHGCRFSLVSRWGGGGLTKKQTNANQRQCTPQSGISASSFSMPNPVKPQDTHLCLKQKTEHHV